MTEKKPLGKILLQQRALTPEQLERALAHKGGGRLASRLAEQGVISDVSALKALSEQHGIPGIDLARLCIKLEDLDLLPREIAEKHLILPVLVRPDRVFIAMANPRERKVIDELEFVTSKKVYPYVALEGPLARVIQVAYSLKAQGESFYIAPHCPPEVLDKLGIDVHGRPVASFGPEPSGAIAGEEAETTEWEEVDERPLDAPGVVVDDAVGNLSVNDEVQDSDFDTSRDLSIVTDLPEHPIGPTPTPDGSKTVLVVDDEADIRRMLKRLLLGRGFRVLEADRGLRALRIVKERMPDLIVLDAMLPEVHGFDIARRIKGSRRYGHIPIIMVSAVYRGWRYAEDLKQSLGVDHYIEKPFRIADVMRAVETCLEQPGGSNGSEAADRLSGEVESALEAGVQAYKDGKMDEAVSHLKRGLGIDPLAYRLHYHLGLLYGRQGQVYEAIRELETAVEINSQHFVAVKNLAILYQKAGFRNKAAEAWERALSLAPDEETRQSIKQHLVTLL
ncbi:MAG TPA: response regulator [Polyangiaceae bacterium]